MLKNLKIGGKLRAGFFTVIALVLIVGVLGMIGAVSLDGYIDRFYNGPAKGVYNATKMESIYFEIMTDSATIYLYQHNSDKDATELMSQLSVLEKEFNVCLSAYEKTLAEGDTENQAIFAEIKGASTGFIQAVDTFIQAVKSDNDRSMETAFENLLAKGEEIDAVTDRMVPLNERHMEEYYGKSQLFVKIGVPVITAGILVAIAIGLLLSSVLRKQIAVPVRTFAEKAKQLAQGLVDVDVKTDRTDEIGELGEAFGEMVVGFQEQARVLNAMAQGDFSVSMNPRSSEDVVGKAIVHMLDNNNNMMFELKSSSEQVSSASQQIAQGAQNLASGSTEQAAAIEELSASISEVLDQSKETAEGASGAFIDIQKAGELMSECIATMNQMNSAMQEINESSNNISKIIAVIDNIAFHTNILALNAAVEAAQAGQHGKGFAVVAEEVRNLASKSADAAKETAELIETSIKRVEEGTRYASQTSESLDSVAEIANRSSEAISKINDLSQRQEAAISEITTGIEQISTVIQSNSATSEQSAAAAEEMSSQASMLNEIVARYKLRSMNSFSSYSAPQFSVQEDLPIEYEEYSYSTDKY